MPLMLHPDGVHVHNMDPQHVPAKLDRGWRLIQPEISPETVEPCPPAVVHEEDGFALVPEVSPAEVISEPSLLEGLRDGADEDAEAVREWSVLDSDGIEDAE